MNEHSYHPDNSGVPQYGTEEYNRWYRANFGPTSLAPPVIPQQPPRKKRQHPMLWGAGGALAMLIVLAIIGSLMTHDGKDKNVSASTPAPTLNSIGYRVIGSAKYGDITFMDGNGDIQQNNGVDFPLTNKDTGEPLWITFKADPGAFLSIDAQNGTDEGTVTCEIRVNGRIVKRVTSSGGYAIASCSGSW